MLYELELFDFFESFDFVIDDEFDMLMVIIEIDNI